MRITWRACALGAAIACVQACTFETAPTEQEEVEAVASAPEQSCGRCVEYGYSVRCGTSLIGSSTIIVENAGSIDARARLNFSYGFRPREISVPVGQPYKQRRSFGGTDVVMTNLTPGATLCMHH
ncbi:hypothetical protein [Sorangium sp. So ce542]|uniref:hypothetical protein n=1 Tax=Sorangium sp. So ce542 TaxID=3133316 RepID=UPI003F5F105D